jgi:eukaryotic-like serine/threonine-protein kinase
LPVNGTSGAAFPFWSPDSRQIGFFAERKLKTVDISSGEVRVLCDARRASGGTWSPQGVIVFSPDVSGPLYRIPAGGGPATLVASASGAGTSQSYRWPFFLPDGTHFLYSAPGGNDAGARRGIFAGSLELGAPKRMSPEFVRSVAFASGYLLFVGGGALVAQPFDPVRLSLSGQPVHIAEGELIEEPGFSPSGFSASQTGILAFQLAADLASHLTWMDANGNALGELPSAGCGDPSLSPDGQLVAVSCDELRNGKHSIFLYDLRRGVTTRLTSGGNDRFPAWSPDAREIAYSTGDGIFRVPVDGSAPSQLVSAGLIPTSWSQDGHILSFGIEGDNVAMTVTSLSNRQSTPLGPGSEGVFSPDDKWIVHGGQDGLVARRFHGPGVRVQIASYGASQPHWSRDGRQVFYITSDKKLMGVTFDPRTGAVGAPRMILQTRIVAPSQAGFQYDVAPDGRFLVNSLSSVPSPITLIISWMGFINP